MNQQAIKPTFYNEFTSGVNEIVQEPVSDDKQEALSYITHFKGWALGKEYAQRLEDYLDLMVSEAISKGLNMSEIGERTMVKEMAKFVLRSFLAKFEDARKIEEK